MRICDVLIRQSDGTLERGMVDMDDLQATGKTERLLGWGRMDGVAHVYNGGGPDVLVPESEATR